MSEYVELNDTVRFGITIHNPSGAYLTNTDETPQWFVYEDDSDTVVLNGNFSQRTGLVGTYRGSFVASNGNGFERPNYYEIHASGKVDGIVGRAVIKTFVLGDIYTVSPTGITNVDNASIADAVWDEQIGGHLNAGTFGSGLAGLSQDIYFANIALVRDETNGQDEYSVCWYKNDRPLASSDISNPAISVYGTRDGSTVFENQTLSFASSKGVTFYDDTSLRIASGEPYLVEASGLIDSSTRNWKTIVGIDVY